MVVPRAYFVWAVDANDYQIVLLHVVQKSIPTDVTLGSS